MRAAKLRTIIESMRYDIAAAEGSWHNSVTMVYTDDLSDLLDHVEAQLDKKKENDEG